MHLIARLPTRKHGGNLLPTHNSHIPKPLRQKTTQFARLPALHGRQLITGDCGRILYRSTFDAIADAKQWLKEPIDEFERKEKAKKK